MMKETTTCKELLQRMFEEMVLAKDAEACARFYDPDFVLETNGQSQDYRSFLESHRRVYATDIRYAVRYDEASWVEQGERLAVRMWISVGRGAQAPRELQVMLVATFRAGLIARLVELTWPDWSQLEALTAYDNKRV
jgi:hypothetical protein